jgi:ABC-type Fe3+-siderophore transport system permease subunit
VFYLIQWSTSDDIEVIYDYIQLIFLKTGVVVVIVIVVVEHNLSDWQYVKFILVGVQVMFRNFSIIQLLYFILQSDILVRTLFASENISKTEYPEIFGPLTY